MDTNRIAPFHFRTSLPVAISVTQLISEGVRR
jgi:hypothetical protein